MQRLITVEGYGQICMGSTLGNLAGVRIDAAGQVYGKHKGTLLADLPGNYLHWFAREGFPKGELGQLLALMHEIDHNGLSDLLRPLRGR